MPKYTVTTPLRHSGEDFAPGEPIELSEKLAAPLVAVGALKPVAAAKSDKSAPAK